MTVTGAILSLPEVAEMTRLVSLKKELVEVVQLKDICFNISAAQLQAVALCGIINCGFPFSWSQFPWVIFFESFPLEQSKERPLAVCYCLNNDRPAAV